MMYEPQIEVSIDRCGLRSNLPTRDAQLLNIEKLILGIRRRWGIAPESITILPGITQPVEVYLNRKLGSF